jgi:hypothetical protein
MADGLFYNDLREPFIAADQSPVTLSTTNKALYTPSAFPVLGGQYFGRIGKKVRIRVFGKITTGATPGNLTLGLYYGTGADANGVLLASSAAIALIASQTNISWMAEFFVSARTLGSAGALFVDGKAEFNVAVIASTAQPIMIPASAAAVSSSCDLTSALILSVQALRSGSTSETMTVQDIEVVAMN